MSGKIYASMAAIMSDIAAIGKLKKNEQQNFKFRGIDDVYNACHPVMAKHGVFCAPEVLLCERQDKTTSKDKQVIYTKLRVKYTFYADDGSSVSTTVEGEGMDYGDKSTAKAMAIAHKYALLQIFCIPTEEIDDPDSDSVELSGKPVKETAPVVADPNVKRVEQASTHIVAVPTVMLAEAELLYAQYEQLGKKNTAIEAWYNAVTETGVTDIMKVEQGIASLKNVLAKVAVK